MNYLPIFSPVCGIVNHVSSNIITININCQTDDLYTPVFGKLYVNIGNRSFIASIMNKYLDSPLKFTIDGIINMKKIDTVEYNQKLGTLFDCTQCQINFDSSIGSSFIPVVNYGSEVNAANSTIGYIKIKQKIIIKTEPKQLIITSIPFYNFDTNFLKSIVKNDSYLKKIIDEIKKNCPNIWDICLYTHNSYNSMSSISEGSSQSKDTELVKSYPKEIRNKIKMKINEIKLSKNIPSELNIIYILDFCSFHSNNFANIRISNPDVSILLSDTSLLLLVEELTDILKENNILATKHNLYDNEMIYDFYQYNTTYELNKYYSCIIPIVIAIKENLSEKKIQTIAVSINKWINTVNLYGFTKFLNRKQLKID